MMINDQWQSLLFDDVPMNELPRGAESNRVIMEYRHLFWALSELEHVALSMTSITIIYFCLRDLFGDSMLVWLANHIGYVCYGLDGLSEKLCKTVLSKFVFLTKKDTQNFKRLSDRSSWRNNHQDHGFRG